MSIVFFVEYNTFIKIDTDFKSVLLSTTLLTLIDKCINRVPNEYKNRGGADDLEYMTLYVCCRFAWFGEE